jgi:hypothetical protein
MRWPRPKEEKMKYPRKDYQKLLSECWKNPPFQKMAVYPSEEKVFALWKDEIERGELERFVWITHYILSKSKLLDALKVDTKRQRIYDEFTGVELCYSDLEDYLYGKAARDEILEFIKNQDS